MDDSRSTGRSPFLRSLTAEARKALDRIGCTRRFTSGQVLIEEGDGRQEVWLLLQGSAKVTRRIDDHKTSLVDIKVSGELLGEIAAMSCGPRTATVTACCDGVARVIAWPDLLLFLREHPEAMIALHQVLGERLRRSDRRRLEFGAYSVLIRLARVLVELADSYGTRIPDRGSPPRKTYRIEVNLTQPEFASLAGAKVRAVQEAFAELSRLELITRGERRTHVCDMDRLRVTALLDAAPSPVKHSA
ncbi:Crp/Fnr family transcriptional regulator [Kitasatospora saccharophila]|uniref:Crp/Fnr family transcriptional regulator n=1 Tax=Kitasatospora saccharophila TaxID=407973 RepID=A0ABN2XHX7_9ACTN